MKIYDFILNPSRKLVPCARRHFFLMYHNNICPGQSPRVGLVVYNNNLYAIILLCCRGTFYANHIILKCHDEVMNHEEPIWCAYR